MSGRIDALRVVSLWVEKAEHDLANATYMMTMPEGCPYDTVCFHAQQCVEKYVKALLTARQIEFPKIHDLTELVSLLPEDMGFHAQLADMSLLNRYAVEARYPGEWEPIARTEAQDAVSVAQGIRKAVRAHLPQELDA